MSYRTIFTDITDDSGNCGKTLAEYTTAFSEYLNDSAKQSKLRLAPAADNITVTVAEGSQGIELHFSNGMNIVYNQSAQAMRYQYDSHNVEADSTIEILLEETQPTQDEEFLNKTGLIYYHNRLKTVFADKTEFDALSAEVDEIISEGGEPNVIETVKVNGVALTPDAQKAVDVTVPTATSDLTNDGDGSSNFATEAYVDANGGKIDVIKVNGTAQTITNKEVDLTVPTKTSDLTNDSNFITNAVNDLVNYYKKTETYTQAEIDALIQTVKTGGFVAVQTLPTASASTMYAIYLVPASSTAADDIKDEYITLEDNGTYSWEKIGTTRLDLSAYWAKSELTAITTAEIDQIIAS